MAIQLIALSVAALLLMSCSTLSASKLQPEPGYQAVFLDSGAVFFGQLQGLGTDYPVLTDAFYVQSVTNPDTKQVNSVLVKRGHEWHAPDKMTLNAHHILFVEPVTAGSTVATLIAQAK